MKDRNRCSRSDPRVLAHSSLDTNFTLPECCYCHALETEMLQLLNLLKMVKSINLVFCPCPLFFTGSRKRSLEEDEDFGAMQVTAAQNGWALLIFSRVAQCTLLFFFFYIFNGIKNVNIWTFSNGKGWGWDGEDHSCLRHAVLKGNGQIW